MKDFKLCVLETPFAGDVEGNIKYARACMKDMLLRKEAPYASHLLYTQEGVLDDTVPEERELGIYAGFAFKHMEGIHTVFYTDRGMSGGMQLALDYCIEHKMSYELRSLEVEEKTTAYVYSEEQIQQARELGIVLGGRDL